MWEIVSRPKGKSVVASKWIYKIKHAANSSIEKYKARFVARGFSQKDGVYYEETFSPVARYTSINMVISLTSVMGWNVRQMDVKTNFLNGDIEEEVYIEQPYGFMIHEKESHVCKFEMKDLGMMHYFLGLEVWQRNDEIFLSQGKYIVEILKKFEMMNLKPMATLMVMNLKKLSVSFFNYEEIDITIYKLLIGSLIYVVNTRPNIFYLVSALSQFMSQLR